MNEGAAIESELSAAVRRGDERAWQVLYAGHVSDLRHHCARMARGRIDLAEEIEQETWIVAVRRIRDFDATRGRFGAWLGGIANRVAKECDRRAGRGEAVLEIDPEAAVAVRGDREVEVARVLDRLPEAWRFVLDAKYREGATVGEIARRLDTSEKAIESRLSRARRAFRALWDVTLDEDGDPT